MGIFEKIFGNSLPDSDNAVILKFRTVEIEEASDSCISRERRLVCQAYDLAAGDLLASLAPSDMAKWLEDQGLSWRPGSSGVYEIRRG